MIRTTEDALRQRIAELEAENARLKDSLEFVKAERRELRERVYGPVRPEDIPTEEQFAELMKDRIDGRKACEELGLLPPRSTQP
jgi:predicted nuclease with TOPRIM domain